MTGPFGRPATRASRDAAMSRRIWTNKDQLDLNPVAAGIAEVPESSAAYVDQGAC